MLSQFALVNPLIMLSYVFVYCRQRSYMKELLLSLKN
jgi:hypothetical protein